MGRNPLSKILHKNRKECCCCDVFIGSSNLRIECEFCGRFWSMTCFEKQIKQNEKFAQIPVSQGYIPVKIFYCPGCCQSYHLLKLQ